MAEIRIPPFSYSSFCERVLAAADFSLWEAFPSRITREASDADWRPVVLPSVVFWESALAAADFSLGDDWRSRITSEASDAALFPVSLLTIAFRFFRSNFGWAVPEGP